MSEDTSIAHERVRTELREMYQTFPEIRPFLINSAFRRRFAHRLTKLASEGGFTTNSASAFLAQRGYHVVSDSEYRRLTAPPEPVAELEPDPGLDVDFDADPEPETLPEPPAKVRKDRPVGPLRVSWDNYRGKLLAAYSQYSVYGSELLGLTDEEAAAVASMPPNACYWKRCGELRGLGLIEPVLDESGEPLLRKGSAGVGRMVCTITDAGISLCRSMEGPP